MSPAAASLGHRLRRFFALGRAQPRLGDRAEIDRLFRRTRLKMVVALTLGYAFFYTCRLGLSVVKKPLIDEGVFTVEQLGWIGAAFLWGYGAGKLVNGFIADRVNVRAFVVTGLAVSALLNLLMGSNSLVAVAFALWLVNGWAQGVGAPASVVGITQWFSGRQRGTMYGIWSTSHSIGEGMTYLGTAALVAWTAWRFAFWGPGLLCLAVALGLFLTLRDRPETLGLPPVEEWDATTNGRLPPQPMGAETSIGGEQLQLLKMPAFWVIGCATATTYVTRYAVNNWGILYLQEEHGYSLMEAGGLIGLNTIAGVGGSVAYGWISDHFFAARRPPLTLIFGLVEIAALLLIFFGPDDAWILGAGFVVYGFTLSGLIAVLGGLFAVDIAPKRAAGAAMGAVGAFSYLGAGIQETLSGLLIGQGTTMVDGVRHYDFSAAVWLWIGASVLSMLLAATLWRVRARP